ncbi:predicted protein [Naegleria gruberi]|uniref:Predicted protein n=1 Tax=Naegleria gruberi TaxID=5762 RepID=D2V4M6_NAEGR|nr:uncharacterized protein NAEGRDRAFT_63845 [Naegleria gruberi]EFC48129.1 predicted protein [Naegleria gruberi]|eukprot:XP_002680873.1 predicted protein [Naegleria gruberi strain NEG-M]
MFSTQNQTRPISLTIVIIMMILFSSLWFGIVHALTLQFLDAETRRGIPMVMATSTNEVSYVSDSNGIVLILEPGYENQIIWLKVQCDGYQLVKSDEFQGISLLYTDDESVKLLMKREQLAERLYRSTGEGIFRESFVAHVDVPNVNRETIKERFLLNSKVTGQDSVMNAIYKGKYYWFYGDTNSISYYLGNFQASGGFTPVEQLQKFGLSIIPNITYFRNTNGFVKGVAPMQSLNLPTWIHALYVDERQDEMFATFMKPNQELEITKRGLLKWNDDKEKFDLISEIAFEKFFSFPIDGSHVVAHRKGVKSLDGWIYFGQPFPLVRTRNYQDLSSYQSYTPLKANTNSYNLSNVQLDFNETSGQLIYDWKSTTSPISAEQMMNLVLMGKIKKEQAKFIDLIDHETGKEIIAHAGTVNFNQFRNKYIMILEQFGDNSSPSILGEIYYSEGETPLGPFKYATKIVSHKFTKHDFYNPSHHVEYDEMGGKVIYFEGTFANTWTNTAPLPRYNYNQQMYRLDIENVMHSHPVPVYKCLNYGRVVYSLDNNDDSECQMIFHARASNCELCIPIYQNERGQLTLKTESLPIFYSLKKGNPKIHKSLNIDNTQTFVFP